jgi:[ribosomal protein S18]-alanine N-acetyltransferase
MDGITIRRARQRDIAAISAIELTSFKDPWTPEILLETLEYFPETFFIAEAGTEVAGFLVGGMEDTGELLYGHICNFAVDDRYRRLGIGTELVARAEHQFMFMFAAGVQLEVRSSNTIAQAFYSRLGYRMVFSIDQYYSNGEDAVVMMKWFRF